MSSLASELGQIDWDFPGSSTTDLLSSIHPYPAKFIPEIPRALIETIGVPKGCCVFDPFCGSGTSLVEAQSAGLPAIGIDLNPIACLISQVKTSPLPISQFVNSAESAVWSAKMKPSDSIIPDIPRLDHWFQPIAQQVISRLLAEVQAVTAKSIRDALRLAISSILVRVSNQESDTRYAAISKSISSEKIYALFLASVQHIANAKAEYIPTIWDISVICKDALQTQPQDIDKPVGLVITSPPYPNAYEYWLYHKYRMFWLGYDPIAVKAQEIGARAHYFKKNHSTPEDFLNQMRTIFHLLSDILVSDGKACFVIGRSKIHGKEIDNAAILTEAASTAGFETVIELTRRIASTRKAFNLSHANIHTERILVFEKRHLSGQP